MSTYAPDVMATAQTLTVCECCLMAAVNGDTSSCEDYWEHGTETHPHPVGAIPWEFAYDDTETYEVWVPDRCDCCGAELLYGANIGRFERIRS